MSDYLARGKTASTAVNTQGVFTGTVTRVNPDLQQVWVEVARLTPGFQYGPLMVAGSSLPQVGDRVAVQFLENRTNDMLVLGVVRTPLSNDYVPPLICTSATRPVGVRAGSIIFETDTLATYVWTGSGWNPVGTGESDVVYSGGEVDGIYTLDLTFGRFHTFTAVGPVEVEISGAPSLGQLGRFTVEVTMGDEFYPITWPTSFEWSFGYGPLAPDVNRVMTISGYTLTGGATWYVRLPDFG